MAHLHSPASASLGALCCLALAACGSGGDKSAGTGQPAEEGADSASAAAPTMAECQDWLAARPHPGAAPACDRDPSEDIAQLAADGAGVVELADGRRAVVWLPEDWESRTQKSVLVVVHGTVGCAEASWGIFRRLLEDEHALVSLEYKNTAGQFAEAAQMQADLDEVLGAVQRSCPMDGARYLMHGVSRGGARAVQLAGLDREGPQRFAGVAVDSGTLSPAEFNGRDYSGAHLWFWCGEHDPDPRGGEQTTCAVMEGAMIPAVQGAGGTVDALVVGEGACHGMFGWDCTEDCGECASQATPRELGPGVTAFVDWAALRLE